MTAIVDGIDVHVLGYFIDPGSENLRVFLASQRRLRMARVREVVRRLVGFGMKLDADAILAPAVADETKTAGRPWVARALVEGGYVETTAQAFEYWLARGRPAFVPRTGAAPREVVGEIHAAGGVASLAHPATLKRDELISELSSAGLDAIEAYHSDHDRTATTHYLALAEELRLAVSGGSDYHADDSHGGAGPGSVSLPPERFDELKERVASWRPH
jgi:predicted metal-dependent phosphoesterase TrpH